MKNTTIFIKEVLKLRNIILLIFIVCNAIAIIYTMAHPLTINFFSLRVMFVALSLVLTILFILLKQIVFFNTKLNLSSTSFYSYCFYRT